MVTDASVFQYFGILPCTAGGRLELSNRSSHVHSKRSDMMSHVSRHARVSGVCPVCQYPLQGRALTKRPCGHLLCSPCFLDAREQGYNDASFNADACEQCRNTPCTKTRHGSTLIEHFAPSKALAIADVALATTAKKVPPRGLTQGKVGPRGQPTGPTGTEARGKSNKLKRRKAQVASSKAKRQVGGFTLASRGDLRGRGFVIPVGDRNTCLADATHVLISRQEHETPPHWRNTSCSQARIGD